MGVAQTWFLFTVAYAMWVLVLFRMGRAITSCSFVSARSRLVIGIVLGGAWGWFWGKGVLVRLMFQQWR